MFWKIIERTQTLAFLLLAVVLIAAQYKKDNTTNEVSAARQDFKSVLQNTITYTEGRVNKLAEVQDDYQNSTSRRLYILEGRLDILEKENRALKLRDKTIITNTNTATAIANGRETE